MQQLPDNNRRFTRERFRKTRGERDGVVTGLFLVLIGAAFLVNRMYPELPNWLFSWKTLLITIGIYVGVKHNFRGGGWAVPIIIGAVFLFIDNFPDMAIKQYIWPIAIIAVGLFIILKPKMCKSKWQQNNTDPANPVSYDQPFDERGASFTNEDVIESTNIFSGSKKINLSKNFRGGELTNIFGGSELNLSKADIQGRVVLEVTCIFGGTKLIIPADWNIQQEAVAIFGGIDDKRVITGLQENPEKILVIKGTVLMGGIDIRSY